jgi:hypothetical protein
VNIQEKMALSGIDTADSAGMVFLKSTIIKTPKVSLIIFKIKFPANELGILLLRLQKGRPVAGGVVRLGCLRQQAMMAGTPADGVE